MNHNPIEKVIVALDNMDRDSVHNFLRKPNMLLSRIKMGLELFCKYGPNFVKDVSEKFDKKVFLDLKLHDIPNTVRKSIQSLEGLNVEFLTIHLSGGKEMIEAAISQAKISLPNTKLLGVSYLTSLSSNNFEQNWGFRQDQIETAFEKLFDLACETQIHGIVCSPSELDIAIRSEEKYGHKLIKVCPGIRFQDEIDQGNTQDQVRVLSPEKAFHSGANFLVMGRSLTQSKDLSERYEQLKGLKI